MSATTDTRSDSRKMLDKMTSEAALQRALIDTAERNSWQVHHETDSRRSKAGLPDLLCVHPVHGLCFIELKAEGGYLKPAQKEWRDVLVMAGIRYFVFRPRDREVADRLFMHGEWPPMEDYSR